MEKISFFGHYSTVQPSKGRSPKSSKSRLVTGYGEPGGDCANYEVVTKFSLAKAVNKGGIAYAKATFLAARPLTAEELPLIAKLSEQIKALSSKVGFEDVDMEPAVLSEEHQMPSTDLQQTA